MANTTWLNADGLLVRYGLTQGLRGNKAGHTSTIQKEKELVLDLTLTGAARTLFTTDRNNDGTLDGFSGMDPVIPAGVRITDVQWIITETPAGGTAWEVGRYALAGTAIDIDGLINDNAGTPEKGADVDTLITADSFVTAVTTGTYTAGKVTVIVKYVTV